MPNHFLRTLREGYGYSQEKMAQEIGVSRPTYAQIEKGERELTVSEARKLSAIFGISLDDLVRETLPEVTVVLEEEPERKKTEKPATDMRVSIPKESIEKFKEVLLYVLQKVGAKPHVGETVIYKLLYFIDFDFYEKFEEQLMGLRYIKNHHGPSPLGFHNLAERMERNGEIERVKSKYFSYEQKKYLPLREADLSKLSAEELRHIDAVLSRLEGMNATQIREYSHEDVPWIVAEEGKPLEYEAVFYRTPKTSVREYDD